MTPRVTPPALAQTFLQRAADTAVHDGKDVGVGVESESYRDVAQKLLDVFGVDVAGE